MNQLEEINQLMESGWTKKAICEYRLLGISVPTLNRWLKIGEVPKARRNILSLMLGEAVPPDGRGWQKGRPRPKP